MTAICPECRVKIVLKNKVNWKSGYIKCPACNKRIYVDLKKDKETKRG